MHHIIIIINRVTDLIVSPFSFVSPQAGLFIVSLISAFILLLAFKRFSNQEKIKFHKDKIYGNFLEIALYRDQFKRTVQCLLNVLKNNLIYLRYFLIPILIIIIPVVIVCLQIEYRMGTVPLETGQSFMIYATLDRDISTDIRTDMDRIRLISPDNIILETPALRIISEARVYWRAKLVNAEAGEVIKIGFEGTKHFVDKRVVTSFDSNRFSPEKRKLVGLDEILAGAEEPLPLKSRFSSIGIGYCPAGYRLLAWNVSPVVSYFILTLILGLILRPFLKVNL